MRRSTLVFADALTIIPSGVHIPSRRVLTPELFDPILISPVSSIRALLMGFVALKIGGN